MKISLILAGLLLIYPLIVNAEDGPAPIQKVMSADSSSNWYPQGVSEGTPATDCDNECQPQTTMKNLVEGIVANVSCLQTCKQRKVWEKLATSISDVADALKKNSYKEVLVPMEMKMDDMKTQLKTIEKKLSELEPPAKASPAK
jgi:dihydroorotate dehydrogenase